MGEGEKNNAQSSANKIKKRRGVHERKKKKSSLSSFIASNARSGG